ncbi:hypothetical protein ACIQV3_21400 [Streptomyces sp. NPDC099050]
MGADLGGQWRQLPSGEPTQTPLRFPQAADAGGELVVDLVQRLLELPAGR